MNLEVNRIVSKLTEARSLNPEILLRCPHCQEIVEPQFQAGSGQIYKHSGEAPPLDVGDVPGQIDWRIERDLCINSGKQFHLWVELRATE